MLRDRDRRDATYQHPPFPAAEEGRPISSERRSCELFCRYGGVVRRRGGWLSSEPEFARRMAFGMTAGELSTEDEAEIEPA